MKLLSKYEHVLKELTTEMSVLLPDIKDEKVKGKKAAGKKVGPPATTDEDADHSE